MTDKREEFSKIAKKMAAGDVEGLFSLRSLVVDLRLSKNAAKLDDPMHFLAIYLSKKIISDVWENLATDASFDFDLEKLQDFAKQFGEILINLLIVKDVKQNEYRLGETVKWLFKYFSEISADPIIVFKKKGENNGHYKI
ncbi:MAG: hypothetical protein KKD44_03960 [Proteobacteria bacterium]|nr:hypothetical protein [Pseudomonadota bacterium]